MSPSTFSKSFVTYILSVFLSASSYTDAPPQIKISRPVFFFFPILLLNFAPCGSFPVQPFSFRTKIRHPPGQRMSNFIIRAASHHNGISHRQHLKFFLSSGKSHGIFPSLPITRFSLIATIIAIIGYPFSLTVSSYSLTLSHRMTFVKYRDKCTYIFNIP